VVLVAATAGCNESSPSDSSPTLQVVFRGSTTRRPDLPASAQACVSGVGATHIHPSWHNFASSVLRAVPPDRYEITLSDVPLDTRVSFRVNDQNFCDLNPTGAVTRNVFANGVELTQNTLTPGSGDEPGYALVVSSGGRVSQ
jgi:hypothetical protein